MNSLIIFVVIFCSIVLHIEANSVSMRNASLVDSMTRTHGSDVDPLYTLGTIALKMVEHIAKAEDEGVEMNQLSDFVTALSRAAVIIKEPKIPQLEKMDEKLTQLDQKVSEETDTFQRGIKQTESDLLDAKSSIGKLKQQLEVATTELNTLKEKAQYRLVGFTASAITHQSFASGTIVKFERVQVNFGHHYDPSVSIFTCPVDGAYVVSVTVEENGSKGLQLDTVMDGERIFHFHDQAGGHAHYMTLSSSVLVECKAKSKIWVQSIAAGQIYAPYPGRNLFSVHLLQQL